jgi:hypothetical protein
MDHTAWIVLVCDPNTSTWSVAVNAPVSHFGADEAEKKAKEFYEEMRLSGDDSTPAIIINTADFVNF